MADTQVRDAIDQAEDHVEPVLDVVRRLASLPTLEYERCRKAEARRLNIRASALDREVAAARTASPGQDGGLGFFEPDPWPEEVSGDLLLDRLTADIRRHVVMPEHAAEVAALWAVHCHAPEIWRHTPRLSIMAPEKGCGKSTLLDVLACLVPRAIKTENLSTAVLFRAVDKFRPTLFIDEVDSFLKDNEELRGCLNAGHAQGGMHLRCEGDHNDIRGFRTFAAAALAGIGSLPATLADRAILINWHKRKADEHVEDLRDDRHLRELASQSARWVQDRETELRAVQPVMPDGIHNRQADNWRALLAIADVAGGSWPARARAAALALAGGNDDAESPRVGLLADIRDHFDELGTDRLSSEQIVSRLHELEDRPWAEYGRQGKAISKNQVAYLLKPFGIKPRTLRDGDRTFKGYSLSQQFKDAFARYLPSKNVTTSQANDLAGFRPISDRHKKEEVTVGSELKAKDSAGCDGVTDEKREQAGEDSLEIPSFLRRAGSKRVVL